nr:type 1 glutamine amidotransferase [Pseudopedobacter sp.]
MKKLRIHYLQHVAFENLGYIEDWALHQGYELTVTKLFENFELPNIQEIDWLIILGGPMGVEEEDKFPWFKAEKAFIKQAIDAKKIVLGICLGAQLIAEVLGGKVYKNKEKEIGWFDVNLTEEGKSHVLLKDLPATFSVFHWHGDTFDIPDGAQHLMYSTACKNQAFSYQNHVLALQFHLEIGPELLKNMLSNEREDLTKHPFVQTEERIIHELTNTVETNAIFKNILDKAAFL